MKRAITIIMALLIFSTIIVGDFAKAQAIALPVDIIWSIFYGILSSLGFNLGGRGDISSRGIEPVGETLNRMFNDFKQWVLNNQTLTYGSIIFMLQNDYWADKIHYDENNEPVSYDVTYPEMQAIGETFKEYKEEKETESAAGGGSGQYTVPIADVGTTTTINNGYYYNEAYAVTAEKTYVSSSTSTAYNVETQQGSQSGTNTLHFSYVVFKMQAKVRGGESQEVALFCRRIYGEENQYTVKANYYVSLYNWVVVPNSEAYNRLMQNPESIVTNVDGFLVSSSYANLDYTRMVVRDNRVYELSSYNPNLPIYTSYDATGQRWYIRIPCIRATEPYTLADHNSIGYIQLTEQEHEVTTGTVTNIAVTVDTSEYASVLGGWQEAITSGQVSQTDAITLSIASTAAQIEAQQNAGINGIIAQSNANTLAICDSITQAAAVTAAATQAGDIDLSQLTIPSIIATRFPFCIPFDIYNAFAGLSGFGREAPHWTLVWMGSEVEIDLAQFESWAAIVRWGLLIAFNLGLIIITRKVIKG